MDACRSMLDRPDIGGVGVLSVNIHLHTEIEYHDLKRYVGAPKPDGSLDPDIVTA